MRASSLDSHPLTPPLQVSVSSAARRDWQHAMTSVYFMLRTQRCPAFYYVGAAPQPMLVLFVAPHVTSRLSTASHQVCYPGRCEVWRCDGRCEALLTRGASSAGVRAGSTVHARAATGVEGTWGGVHHATVGAWHRRHSRAGGGGCGQGRRRGHSPPGRARATPSIQGEGKSHHGQVALGWRATQHGAHYQRRILSNSWEMVTSPK
jgi:hypothetical protein